jgi:hypothetical protein
MTTRNDNYGGDSLLRLQRSVDSIVYGAETVQLLVELVIVEWNPPKDRPYLKEVIRFPAKSNYVSLRIIIVPFEIHIDFNVKVPLIEYIAKNTGIRRARGEFILCSNPDNYFPLSFFQALAKEPLNVQSFYRADRYDVISPNSVFDSFPPFVKEYILTNTIIFAKVLQGYFSVPFGKSPPVSFEENKIISQVIEKDIYFGPAGDFLLASRTAWFAMGGFKESLENPMDIDNIGCLQMLALGLKQRVFSAPVCTLHFDHLRSARKANKLWLSYIISVLNSVSINPINASGWGLKNLQLEEFQLGTFTQNKGIENIDVVFSNKIDPNLIPCLIKWEKTIEKNCSKLWRILWQIRQIIKYCLPYGLVKLMAK